MDSLGLIDLLGSLPEWESGAPDAAVVPLGAQIDSPPSMTRVCPVM